MRVAAVDQLEDLDRRLARPAPSALLLPPVDARVGTLLIDEIGDLEEEREVGLWSIGVAGAVCDAQRVRSCSQRTYQRLQLRLRAAGEGPRRPGGEHRAQGASRRSGVERVLGAAWASQRVARECTSLRSTRGWRTHLVQPLACARASKCSAAQRSARDHGSARAPAHKFDQRALARRASWRLCRPLTLPRLLAHRCHEARTSTSTRRS